MYDTLIIGAGMSGLAAGIRLAHYERRVAILERHTTIGGLNSFYRLRGRDYDVGLHAVTNYSAKGARRGPLAKLLRQLRFNWDEFDLSQQAGSTIAFPGVELHFDNDPARLEAEIARKFPRQIDNYRRLLTQLIDYDDLSEDAFRQSARDVVSRTIDDPLLVEMLLCPVMWYGNARERDMDFALFCIMFRSIYLEGLSRPFAGIRLILRKLVRKFRALGGELKLRSGVSRIKVEEGQASGVVLDSGEEIAARSVLSSAGLVETLRLCDAPADLPPAGQLSFAEALSVLDGEPSETGFDRSVVFFNDSTSFHWEKPPHGLCDVRSGTICSPNNFLYDRASGKLPDGVIRVTALAHFDRWTSLPEEEYQVQKLRWYDKIMESAVRFVPEFRHRVIDTDMFTPRTIRRFTGHENGAVYGAPDKRLDGTTHVKNLFVCGTDQGYVGIIGSLISGIAVANRHLLRGAS